MRMTNTEMPVTDPPLPEGRGRADADAGSCYHCHQPVPPGLSLRVRILGHERPMCCRGCEAVARAIVDYRLDNFYRFRTAPSPTPEELVPAELRRLQIYDDAGFQSGFVDDVDTDVHTVHLLLAGMVCPACTWLIESRLSRMPGIQRVAVNYSSNRASISWHAAQLNLSDILRQIRALGYQAWPYDPDQRQALIEQERKSQLRRIGLAGVLGMQVMMLSSAIYIGDWTGMDLHYRTYFHWICLLLTTPVVLHSARPFFVRACRDLRQRTAGMDVPVSLGIAIAYGGSIHATVAGSGQVYFDSVVMFVFLLSSARYFEFTARQRAAARYDDISRIIPATATRVSAEGAEETIAVASLVPGDRLLVCPGETVPADGVVVEGASCVDESIITGESLPLSRTVNDAVIGGSVNIESPLQVTVEKTGRDTLVSQILRLVEEGQRHKPALTDLTNRIAAWFVGAVILLALAVAVYWWYADPALWLPATIALLVITCPCALSLAAPVALTGASSALLGSGMALVNSNALETLARTTHIILDKTGTLTRGELRVTGVICLAGAGREDCLALAAALETGSEHPVARAIRAAAGPVPRPPRQPVNTPGAGVTAVIDGSRYWLGSHRFIREQTGHDMEPGNAAGGDDQGPGQILLANARCIMAVMLLEDEIRPGAGTLIETLRQERIPATILSGDNAAAVRNVSRQLGIDAARHALLPQDKLAAVADLVRQGEVVAVVGDGVNDAPVLAAAHVSIAMGAGVDIARLNADMILLNNSLATLAFALLQAKQTTRIIRQNILWAIAYNLLALPVAAAGLVAPWLAAVGMSLSSLVVIGNSRRLQKY